MNWSQSPVVDQVGIEERVARFNTRSIKKESKMQGLKLALSMIDLTTLEGKDTEERCSKCVTRRNILPMIWAPRPLWVDSIVLIGNRRAQDGQKMFASFKRKNCFGSHCISKWQ